MESGEEKGRREHSTEGAAASQGALFCWVFQETCRMPARIVHQKGGTLAHLSTGSVFLDWRSLQRSQFPCSFGLSSREDTGEAISVREPWSGMGRGEPHALEGGPASRRPCQQEAHQLQLKTGGEPVTAMEGVGSVCHSFSNCFRGFLLYLEYNSVSLG